MQGSNTSVSDRTTNNILEIVRITTADHMTATMERGRQPETLATMKNEVDVAGVKYCQRNKKDECHMTATMKRGRQPETLTTMKNEVDVASVRNKKDEWYLQALKVYYFPFLLKNHKCILIVWLCVFTISLVYGPALLSLTRTKLDQPAGTPSATAVSVFKTHFAEFSTYAIT